MDIAYKQHTLVSNSKNTNAMNFHKKLRFVWEATLLGAKTRLAAPVKLTLAKRKMQAAEMC